jgi:hypothetical protein
MYEKSLKKIKVPQHMPRPQSVSHEKSPNRNNILLKVDRHAIDYFPRNLENAVKAVGRHRRHTAAGNGVEGDLLFNDDLPRILGFHPGPESLEHPRLRKLNQSNGG